MYVVFFSLASICLLDSDSSRTTEFRALRLLLSHVGIRLLNCPKDELVTTKEVLTDLLGVVESRLSKDEDMSEDEDQGKQGPHSRCWRKRSYILNDLS